MYKAVLFDLDGTLLDTKEIILRTLKDFYCEYLNTTPPTDEELIKRYIGPPLKVSFAGLIPDYLINAAIDEYRRLNNKYHDDYIKAFQKAQITLKKLKKKNIKTGVVSSKVHSLVKHGLFLTGLLEYIDVIIGVDDCDEHKPAAKPLLKAISHLNVSNKQAIYVGDHPNDIQAAKNAKITSVAVTYSDFLKEILAEQPDFIIDHLDQVLDLV